MPTNEISTVARLVEQEIAKPAITFRLDRNLRAMFDAEFVLRKTGETIYALVFCLAVFDALLLSDTYSRALPVRDAIFVRLIVVTLPALLGLILIYAKRTETIRNWVVALTSGLMTIGLVLMFLKTDSRFAAYDAFAFTLLPVIINTLVPLRFVYALASTAVNVLIMTVAIVVTGNMNYDVLPAIYLAAFVSLLTNYRLERNAIDTFLNLLLKSLRQFEMDEANRYLKVISREDPLTGLANRREFEATLAGSWATAVNTLDSYSVLMIDIDFFKSFNDLHGHPAGDDCLRRVAAVIFQQVRTNRDLAARIGGEEFCVLMPGATLQAAETLAERIRSAVERSGIPHGGMPNQPCVTVSVGVASSIAKFCESGEALVALADKALYEAKHAGRNRNRIMRMEIAA